MGCYGYCVAAALTPQAELSGIGGARVVARDVAGMKVWVSEIERPDPDVAHVKAHNAVVEAAISDDATPVPLRFGQWSADFSEFDRLIADKAEWYRERLTIFAGALEFGIRVVRPDKQAAARVVRLPRADSGTAYMEALRAGAAAAQSEREEADRVRMGVAATMKDLVREEHSEAARTPHGIITVAHLVGREHFEAYHARMQELREQFPELRFLLSGPWAPYSFAA